MKKQPQESKTSGALILPKLHVLFWCLFVASNCMKKPDMTEDDGPIIDNKAFRQNLVQGWGDFDLLQIKKNEFVALRQTQELQNASSSQGGDFRIVQEEGVTVCDRQETADAVIYDFLHQVKEYGNDQQSRQSTTHIQFPPIAKANENGTSVMNLNNKITAKLGSPLQVLRAGPAAEGGGGQIIPLLHNLNAGLFWILYFAQKCEESDPNVDSCHNFTVTDELRPVPERIQKEQGCGGFENCQIPIKKINFVYISRSSEPGVDRKVKQKTFISLSLSPKVPYLSRLLDFCFSTLLPVGKNGQKVFVKMCNEVTDFQDGDNTSQACQGTPFSQ